MSGISEAQFRELENNVRNGGRGVLNSVSVPQSPSGELRKSPRGHKYGAKKKEVDGITFDSTSEANAYGILKLWSVAGVIVNLKLQPEFVLQEKFIEASADGPRKTHRAIKYIADFQFQFASSSSPSHTLPMVTVVDVKGILTPTFRIKEKMFRQKFPQLDLQIWNRDKVRELSRG